MLCVRDCDSVIWKVPSLFPSLFFCMQNCFGTILPLCLKTRNLYWQVAKRNLNVERMGINKVVFTAAFFSVQCKDSLMIRDHLMLRLHPPFWVVSGRCALSTLILACTLSLAGGNTPTIRPDVPTTPKHQNTGRGRSSAEALTTTTWRSLEVALM